MAVAVSAPAPALEVSLKECIAKIVGARLRELRRDAEMTQTRIAKLTGIHRPIISRIERGTHEASLDTVSRYARALELDVATVLVCLDVPWLAAKERWAHV